MPPAAILKDGELAAAVEESKLVRRRTHWRPTGELPEHSIATCLELAGAKPEQVDAVAIVRPLPETDFHLKLRAQFPNSRIVVVEHHLAHAASAYYPSPFDEATVLTLDRGGDFRCGSRWQARGTANDARAGAVFAGFAGRPLRPRDRTARLRRQRRTSTRCSGSRCAATTATATCSSRSCGMAESGPAPRPLVLQHRSASSTAASARGSTSGSGLNDGAADPRSAAGARGGGHPAGRGRRP